MLPTLLVCWAYLLGSIPVAVLVARASGGPDPRTAGSGNPGASNVARTSGWTAGLVTLVGDMSKGVAAVLLVRWMGLGDIIEACAGLAVVMGHIYPLTLGFRGGKGVATSCGVFLLLQPPAALVALISFFVVTLVSKISAVGSLCASAVLLLGLWWTPTPPPALLLGVVIVTLVVTRHRENILRLLERRELKVGP